MGKILVANYRYFIAGGPERYMFNFIKAAEDRGIEVIPFSVQNKQNEPSPYSSYFAKPRSDSMMYSDTRMSFKNLYGIFRATLWNFDASRRIRKLIRDTKPDVVYILHEINHLSPSIIHAAKKEGVRVVHRISDFFMLCARYDFLHGNSICEECLSGNYSSAIKYKCMKGSLFGTCLRVIAMYVYKYTKVFDEVDTYIATCNFSRNKLIEGGIRQNKITVVPTFIDVESITPRYDNKGYFLFLGRMSIQKGVIYAVEAMRYLASSDYVLKITGDLTENSEDYDVINGLLSKYNISEKVEFVGFQSGRALEDLIDGAICVLCPSIWYDNMPNSVLEAYAHGKPVIASRIGSLEEMVEDNQTGLLFTPKDSEDLAHKMIYISENADECIRMGQNARERCSEMYSVNRHMENLLDILGV